MEKIALVTDSASSVTVKTAAQYGVHLLKMPIIIGEESFYEDISITYEEFINRLKNKATPKTSQPAIGEAIELFDALLKEYDYIIVVPISKALSSTYSMLVELAKNYQGRIYIADSRVVSGNQFYKLSKVKAKIDAGVSFADICHYLEDNKDTCSVYLVPEDVSHLRRTGRASAAKVFFASVFNFYPILELKGTENFKAKTKARGFRRAITEMVNMHLKDGINNKDYMFVIMQIDNMEYAEFAASEVRRIFGEDTEIEIHNISPVIASHTGNKTIAVCANKKA